MSADPKLTPWFPHGTKPARDGVYEVVFYRTPGYAHYRAGKNWSRLCETPQEASTALPAGCVEPKWRGLTENPIHSQDTQAEQGGK